VCKASEYSLRLLAIKRLYMERVRLELEIGGEKKRRGDDEN